MKDLEIEKVAYEIAKSYSFNPAKKISMIKAVMGGTGVALSVAKKVVEEILAANEYVEKEVEALYMGEEKLHVTGYPTSKIGQKYKVYIWTLTDEINPTALSAWQLITKEISLGYDEVKAVIEKCNQKFIVFARKAGSYKKPYVGALWGIPSNVSTYFAKTLYQVYLNNKKGVASYSELDIPKTVPKPAYTEKTFQPDETWFIDRLGCATYPSQSQKIKGLRLASTYMERVTDINIIRNSTVIMEEPDFSVVHNHYNGLGRVNIERVTDTMVAHFCRQAPNQPNHGGVESVVVHTKEEALDLIKRVREANGNVEMIVMPKIECDYSGVICPDGISFGPLNDGATSGHNGVDIKINLGDEGKDAIRKGFWKSSEWPYAEVLYSNNVHNTKPILVQLRSGPSQPTTPKKVKIVAVYDVAAKEAQWVAEGKDALIEWGKECLPIRKSVKEVEGEDYVEETTAIWHPNGTFLSHYAVWCLMPGYTTIPYITDTNKPVIGSVIEMGKGISEPKYSEIRNGLLLGLEAEIEGEYPSGGGQDWHKAVADLHNFLGSLHIASILDLSDKTTARFLGYAWGIGARVISGLPFGELTHHATGRQRAMDIIGHDNMPTHERDYGKIWKLPLELVIPGLVDGYGSFTDLSWSAGYGGKAWGNCTSSLLGVFAKIRSFINVPSNENYMTLLNKINVMINEVHNGAKHGNGTWLDKMTHKQLFDDAAVLPHFLLSPKRALEAKTLQIGAFSVKLKTSIMLKKLDVEDIEGKLEEVKKDVAKKELVAKKKALVDAKVKAKKVQEELEKVLKNQEELKNKIGYGKGGQFYIGKGEETLHIQFKTPAKDIDIGIHSNPTDYGYSINVKVGDKIGLIEKFYNGYKAPVSATKGKGNKLESFATPGVFKYAPITVYVGKEYDYCYLLVGRKIVPIEDNILFELVKGIQLGEEEENV